MALVHNFLRETEKVLPQGGALLYWDELIEFYFQALGFERISELFDEHYTTYAEKQGKEVHFKLYCLYPSKNIRSALASQRQGNYLAFFPSYKYMEEVATLFADAHGDIETLFQKTGMSEREREAFLAVFDADNAHTTVGVGLPQICLERDLIRHYFDQHELSGFEYAYTYPGMNSRSASGRPRYPHLRGQWRHPIGRSPLRPRPLPPAISPLLERRAPSARPDAYRRIARRLLEQ